MAVVLVVAPDSTSPRVGTSPVSTRLTALYMRITGTPHQQAASDYLGYRALNDPITGCMTANRWTDYRPEPFLNQWHGARIVAGVATYFLAPPRLRIFSQSTRALVPLQREDRRLATAEPPVRNRTAYLAALRSCQRHRHHAATRPESEKPLLAAYDRMVLGTDARLARTYLPGYKLCMRMAGYHITEVDSLHDLIQSHLSAVRKIPAPGRPVTPQWRKALDYERTALDADAACRGDAYAAGMRQLGPAINQFETKHRDQLVAITGQWKTIVARADAYPGSPGF